MESRTPSTFDLSPYLSSVGPRVNIRVSHAWITIRDDAVLLLFHFRLCFCWNFFFPSFYLVLHRLASYAKRVTRVYARARERVHTENLLSLHWKWKPPDGRICRVSSVAGTMNDNEVCLENAFIINWMSFQRLKIGTLRDSLHYEWSLRSLWLNI